MSRPLLLIELNEVNFDFIEAYVARGALPNLAQLIREHGIVRTTSEERYEQLEPWIQWVTAHTGLSYAEHSVFRLGDIVERDLPQIWEELEAVGYRVGALSPMNAKYRLRDPAFFVPDPWTRTEVRGRPTLRDLHAALAQAVNDNATARITAGSAWALLKGLLVYARPANYARYLALVAGAIGRPWRKAMFLDLLLADVFIAETRRTQPHFASLFLNAAAHIQHHYMFCAAPYEGPHRNPTWYIPAGIDPVLEIYTLYDDIVGALRRELPTARLMLATGLHQVPHEEATFYWRLKNHVAFLASIGVSCREVEPRMSRDFVVRCQDRASAARAADRLRRARAQDGLPLFEVDDRGDDLFVMLTYPREIDPGFAFHIDSETFTGLHAEVAFVALKNGEHDGIGYFLDTGVPKGKSPEQFPLADLPRRVKVALGSGPPLPGVA